MSKAVIEVMYMKGVEVSREESGAYRGSSLTHGQGVMGRWAGFNQSLIATVNPYLAIFTYSQCLLKASSYKSIH